MRDRAARIMHRHSDAVLSGFFADFENILISTSMLYVRHDNIICARLNERTEVFPAAFRFEAHKAHLSKVYSPVPVRPLSV